MTGPEWLQFQHVLMIVFVFISILFNACLITLIQRKSPKNLGPYKHLMIFISVFEIIYSIMDYLVLPIMHSFGSSFFIMTPVNIIMFGKPTALIMQAAWCGFFGASMAIFGIHFVYRYLAVTGSTFISTFKGFKILFWLSIPIAYGCIWGLVSYFCCGPKDELSAYIRENLMESFELSVDDVVYIGIYLYTENGDFLLDSDVIITLTGAVVLIGSSLFTIFYLGFKCYRALTDNGHSQHYRTLQTQFFLALVLQTVIPITLMHFPFLVSFSGALLNYGIGKLSNLVSITIAFYPVVDPLPTVFIIKNYRVGLKEYCLFPCKFFKLYISGVAKSEAVSTVSRRISTAEYAKEMMML
ncbi:unnamed protein product [Caenorhabditis sp. 36 PRJEB53466]|nr:unnamed protein product [Caenorhabditis sp. 36 PRJEB53466]